MTTDSDSRPEAWKPVAPMDGCTFSGYEASDKGQYRSVDRTVRGRAYRGQMLKPRLDEDGYVLINIRCDSTDPGHDRRHTFLGHKVVLTTFDRPCPPGMEARHSARGPAFNWWPEGVRWGTKAENHADMVEAGTAVVPAPSFPCVNAPACGNLNRAEGKRCRPCVVRMGVDAAADLNAGRTLAEVAARFRCSQQWAYRLAAEHGGYAGTPADARGDTACPDCAARAGRRRRLLRVVTLGIKGRRSPSVPGAAVTQRGYFAESRAKGLGQAVRGMGEGGAEKRVATPRSFPRPQVRTNRTFRLPVRTRTVTGAAAAPRALTRSDITICSRRGLRWPG
jgi:NUMOD4 motif